MMSRQGSMQGGAFNESSPSRGVMGQPSRQPSAAGLSLAEADEGESSSHSSVALPGMASTDGSVVSGNRWRGGQDFSTEGLLGRMRQYAAAAGSSIPTEYFDRYAAESTRGGGRDVGHTQTQNQNQNQSQTQPQRQNQSQSQSQNQSTNDNSTANTTAKTTIDADNTGLSGRPEKAV